MASKTDKDVINKALRACNIISQDESATGDLYSDVSAEYVSFHEWLTDQFPRQVTWSHDRVPESYFNYVAGWFAGEVLDAHSVGESTYSRVKEAALKAERRLRQILARKSRRTVQVPSV